MTKIKNLKYYANTFLLTMTLSLTGCSTNQEKTNCKSAEEMLIPKQEKTKETTEKEYPKYDLYFVNTDLIDEAIPERCYIVKKDKIEEGTKKCSVIDKDGYTKCIYNKKTKTRCYEKTFSSLDKNYPATLILEQHVVINRTNSKQISYFNVKADINGEKYEKMYKIKPAIIHEISKDKEEYEVLRKTFLNNAKKLQKFENTIVNIDKKIKKSNQKNTYTESDIKRLSKKLSRQKGSISKTK